MKCCCDDLKKLLTDIKNNIGTNGGGTTIDYTSLIDDILVALADITNGVNTLPDYSPITALVQELINLMTTQLITVNDGILQLVSIDLQLRDKLDAMIVQLNSVSGWLNNINNALLLSVSQEATQQSVLTKLTELYDNSPIAGTKLQSTTHTLINIAGSGLIPALAASARAVSIRTSVDFVGTIGGVTFPADDVISFTASEYRILEQIPYEIVAGNIITRTINV